MVPLDPEILLMDEPTAGPDAEFKQVFAEIPPGAAARRGVTILMVSHDIEFCARYARCALFFDGGIASGGRAQGIFLRQQLATTANRMARSPALPRW
ncbi:MAG: hypothetical protein ACLSAF_21990 [Intestinimonas sp.]